MRSAPDPRAIGDAVLDALDRLASSLASLSPEDVDELSRAIGSTRRAVAVELASRVVRVVAAHDLPSEPGASPDADDADALDRDESGDGQTGDGQSGDGQSGDGQSGDGESGDGELLALGDGPSIAVAVLRRRDRLAAALEATLPPPPAAHDRLVDELRALLAHVELVHVALEVGYELDDLPPESAAACAHVTDAVRRARDAASPRLRARSIARRRRGIAWPPGRRSP